MLKRKRDTDVGNVKVATLTLKAVVQFLGQPVKEGQVRRRETVSRGAKFLD
jgi:hypothetical protein